MDFLTPKWQQGNRKAVPMLYLDLDGTVRQGKDDALGRFVNGPEDVVVFPEAIELMRRWKDGGGRIVGVSNQGGIALGIISEQQAGAAMMETHRQTGKLFDRVAYCGHHPEATDLALSRCWCRKPAPGLLVAAALDLARQYPEYYPAYMALMVGDRPEDEQCAKSVNVDFMWAADWRKQVQDQKLPGSY